MNALFALATVTLVLTLATWIMGLATGFVP